MRGFASGAAMLQELCLKNYVVAIQEHWLDNANLHKLGLVNSNYSYFGVSGMNQVLSHGLLRGRPFGGVAFLWNNDLSNAIKVIGSDSDGRCIAISLQCDGHCIIIINVYFPCFDGSVEYNASLSQCIGFIENILVSNAHSDVIVLGDTNFPCVTTNAGFNCFNKFLDEFSLLCCDDLSGNCDTYINVSLNQSSCIDHVFVNAELKDLVTDIQVADCVFNHSDHWPVCCTFNINARGVKGGFAKRQFQPKRYHVRWDKANLTDFYDMSYQLLSDRVKVCDTHASCTLGCTDSSHCSAIDRVYNDIVAILQQCELFTVPRIPQRSLKPFWNEYLDELKEKSVFWGSVWKDAGCPRSGELFRIKTACSLKYKTAIKQAIYEYEHSFDDKLFEHFINKEPSQFWKSWNQKFHRNMCSNKTVH